MNELDRQLATAVKNLSALDEKAVPRASSMAINRIATRAISHSVKDTSKAVKVQQKSSDVTPEYPKSFAKAACCLCSSEAYRHPSYSHREARTQIRRKGRYQVQSATRGKDGRYNKRDISGFTSIKVGKHKFDNAFLQKLENGKWHIMQRTSESRYPIKLCAIPIKNEITTAFEANSKKLMKTDMPKELTYAMSHQIRLVIRREVGRGN